MSTNQDQLPTLDAKTPSVSPGRYNPVTVSVHDTLGSLFLGIFAGILLIGWMRAEARNRELIK